MERVEVLHGAGELDAWFRGTSLRSASPSKAVVEVPTTTVAIPRDSHGVVDALGNLVLRYEQGSLA